MPLRAPFHVLSHSLQAMRVTHVVAYHSHHSCLVWLLNHGLTTVLCHPPRPRSFVPAPHPVGPTSASRDARRDVAGCLEVSDSLVL
ncbi:hypothetical protein FKP32DRAFT_364560 [Trametes sanguinea]|nr:hypothetical protein FKP32DRAFT_364560 [Trametes sanguinea]